MLLIDDTFRFHPMKNNFFKFISILIVTFIIFWLLIPAGLILLGRKLDVVLNINFPDIPLLNISAIIILIVGFYICLKSIMLLLVNGEGIPFSLFPPKRLVRESLYSHSRNPIYVGFILIMISLGTFFKSTATIILVLPVFTVFLIGYILFVEEPLSLRYYKKSYEQYKEQIPFFWSFKKREPKGPSLFRLFFHIIVNILSKLFFSSEVEGKENIPESGPALFISNHTCYLDPFFLASHSFRNIYFLTTAEVFRKVLPRLFFNLMGSFPLKRFMKNPIGIRRLFKLLDSGYAIGYFPEGERTWTGHPLPFPQGAAKLLARIKATIIPVSICGAYAVMPRWTNKFRRAKIKIVFHHPFKIEKSWNEDEIETKLSEIIHTSNMTFDNHIYSKTEINEGIHRLFWRCPVCGDFYSLQSIDDDNLLCIKCKTKWRFTQDNELEVIEPKNFLDPKRKFWEWYQLIMNFKFPEFNNKENSDLLSHKSLPCILSIGNYPKFKPIDRGCLTLHKKGIYFIGAIKDMAWDFEDLDFISTEGNDKLQIIRGNTQVQFLFQEESNLKWETFINHMRNPG